MRTDQLTQYQALPIPLETEQTLWVAAVLYKDKGKWITISGYVDKGSLVKLLDYSAELISEARLYSIVVPLPTIL